MHNVQLAEMFSEIADMLSLDPDISRFEVLAYRKAAQTLEGLNEDVGDIYKKKGVEGLLELPGIGKSIAGSIKEYLDTGKMQKFERLKKSYPVDFKNLTKVQGVGSKRAFRLYQTLKIRNISDLKKAVANHRIRDLEGFGEKSESEIAKGIAQLEASKGRMPLGYALPEAEAIVKKLKESGLVEKVILAGSSRRMKETVGDLDILITTSRPEPVISFIHKMEEVERVLVSGPTKTTVLLRIGLNCDFRIVDDGSFGAALQYFTGNKDHNVKIREIAIKLGLKLNEYGIFDKKERMVAGKTEEEVYSRLGMQWMEPEMRENRGEVELALKHQIPVIIQESDIRGDLHTHTTDSDGTNTLQEMAEFAQKLGREYIGISNHSKSEYQARGMDDAKFRKHLDAIDRLQAKLDGIKILKGAEIDILKDGSLDLENGTMKLLDYRLASIHTNLNLTQEEMTRRVIRAFDSGYVDVWAHPTDRLINQRPPINVDLDKVFDAAERNNVILEIDSYPERLDLNDENILKAKNYRVRFSIDTDSHATQHMRFMRYGVATAKRAWLPKELVVNTLPMAKLYKLFHKP